MKQSPAVAFIVMPFSDDIADSVYRYSTQPLLESLNFKPIRADEIFGTSPIFDDIVLAIQQAALVVVDISGLNPNVMYELGMAHMIKQAQTIIITHDPLNSLPFDIRHFRIIGYEDTFAGKTRFETSFRKTVEAIQTGTIDLYRSAFDVIEQTVQPALLYTLMALAQVTTPVLPGSFARVAGHNTRGRSEGTHQDIHFALRSLIRLDYVRVLNNRMVLTEKGQLLIKYLELQGWVVERFNDQRFTEEHKDFFEEVQERNRADEASSKVAEE